MSEKEYEYELTIDDLPKPKMPISEPGGRAAKGPTICVWCKHCFVIPKPKNEDYVCDKKDIDFVSGKLLNRKCKSKNHGNCPDYDPVRG